MQSVRCIVAAVLLVVMSSCVPAADRAADALNSRTGDALELLLVPGEGVVVIPAGLAVGVIVSVFADRFESYDADTCVPVSAYVLECNVGDISDRVTLAIRGRGVSADVIYFRPGVNRVYREQALSP